MPTQLLLTRFLNDHFAAHVTAFLNALHVHPVYPEAPITNAFAMELLVFLVLIAYFIAVRMTLDVERPKPVQHLAEMTHEFVSEQGEQIIGHGSERFVSYLTALLLFILLANLMGIIPGLESPTANAVVPLGFALVTFIYYHYHGVRENGFGLDRGADHGAHQRHAVCRKAAGDAARVAAGAHHLPDQSR